MAFPGFVSHTRITWPKPFGWYRIALVIAQLPDFVWVETERRYMPVVSDLDGCTVKVFTDWKQRSTTPEDVVLEASFASPALTVAGTTVIVALGVEVLPSTTNVTDSDQTGMGSLKIVACFTE